MAQMAPTDAQQGPAACCQPGDITVTDIYSGFMLGRALEPRGPGPWWEYVAIVRDEAAALHQALMLARFHGTQAYRHFGGDRYEPIVDTMKPVVQGHHQSGLVAQVRGRN